MDFARKLFVYAIALLAFAIFLATSFRAGWTRAETDFPNYYTAAVLVTKREPLRNFYEWTWFQRQMNYAGVENQLGGYIPQTPVTMVPMLILTKFTPQNAKRAWLLLNLVFLLAIILLLSRITRFGGAEIAILTFSGFGTLHTNFLLGQYYVFLLLLLVIGFYFISSKGNLLSGFFFGLAFVLKLYGGPFALYFAAKRLWRGLSGLLLAFLCAVLIACAVFGWSDLSYFALHILPRALQGETIDPYNSGNGTISTFLRRIFVFEPELNSRPIWNAPWLFFFLQPLVAFLLVIIPLMIVRRSGKEKRDFAFFCLALLLASPNVASYTFVLLLLPVVLLLDEAGRSERVLLIVCYILLSAPVPNRWSFLFPKLWLLLFLVIWVARGYERLLRPRELLTALAFVATAAFCVAWWHERLYLEEPGRRWEHVIVQPGAIYSSSPVVVRSGIVYESIGRGHYVLRWLHNGRNDEFAFPGEALNPAADSTDGLIAFELIAHARSIPMELNLQTEKATPKQFSYSVRDSKLAVSNDRRWTAFTKTEAGSEHIWIQRTNGGHPVQIAGGNCNSYAPAWELDSQSLVFASDCDRGIGLPALYRARLNRFAGY